MTSGLTDAEVRRAIQRDILSKASTRLSGFILPLPVSTAEHPALTAEIIQEMIEREFVVERPIFAHEAYWLGDDDPRQTVLVITALGQRALAADPRLQAIVRDSSGAIRADALPFEAVNASPPTTASRLPAGGPPRGKLGVLVTRLSEPGGATLQDLCNATGWQPRSVRAAVSSSLVQRGFLVTSAGRGADRLYRIEPSQSAAAVRGR